MTFLEGTHKYNIHLVGINSGDETNHQNFCNKKGLEIPVLSYIDRSVSKKFNAVNIFGMNKRKLALVSSKRKILLEKTTIPINFIDTASFFNELKSLKII